MVYRQQLQYIDYPEGGTERVPRRVYALKRTKDLPDREFYGDPNIFKGDDRRWARKKEKSVMVSKR